MVSDLRSCFDFRSRFALLLLGFCCFCPKGSSACDTVEVEVDADVDVDVDSQDEAEATLPIEELRACLWSCPVAGDGGLIEFAGVEAADRKSVV